MRCGRLFVDPDRDDAAPAARRHRRRSCPSGRRSRSLRSLGSRRVGRGAGVGGSGHCRVPAGRAWRPASRAGHRSWPGRGRSRPSESAASRPAGVDGIAIERRVGDADLERSKCASDTATPGQAVIARERGGLLVPVADDPRVVRLDPVDLGARLAIARVAEQRAAQAVERVGDPDERRPARGRRRSSRRPTARARSPARGRGR